MAKFLVITNAEWSGIEYLYSRDTTKCLYKTMPKRYVDTVNILRAAMDGYDDDGGCAVAIIEGVGEYRVYFNDDDTLREEQLWVPAKNAGD
jgi:hypothetical protein